MRRYLLALLVAGLIAALAGGSATLAAQGPIKIGLVTATSGIFAPNGRDMINGFELALKEAGNKAAGRPIELLVEDDQGLPGPSLTKARKLVELEKVDLLSGPLAASSGYVLRDYVDEQRIPALFPVVSSDDLTQRKTSAWVVRTGWTSSQPNHPFGEYAAKTLHYKRIATIAYDFAFGWETVEGFQDSFEQNGGRVVEHLWPPIGAPDYSPYLGRIQNVDAVYATFSGNDALRFLQQYRAFGFMGRIPLIGNGTLTDEHILFQENDLAKGIITPLHYSAALKTDANRTFVRAYVRAFNRVPSYYSEACYTGMQVILKALQATGGKIEDRAAFVAAMRKVTLPDAPRGPLRFDAYGAPIQNVYIRRVDIANGEPQNTVIFTYPSVSQFWTYNPVDYLKKPVYTRDLPPAHP
ncbi:MAG TPA: ABC transporter substrate-binding protein [bacterium]|nr:ABC transporter substrate-binding protein [bacterium]